MQPTVTPEEINSILNRLLDSEEHASDTAIPPIAEHAADLIRCLFPSTPEALREHIETCLQHWRGLIDEPGSLRVRDKIDLEFFPATEDNRINVGRVDRGYTTVNYTDEGLILDVFSADPAAMESLHTASIYQDELIAPEINP